VREDESDEIKNGIEQKENAVDTLKPADVPSSVLSEKRLCPCCGKIKSLQETFGPKITAIAIAACRDFAQTFRHNGITIGEGGSTYHVCASCRRLASLALNVAKEKHPECESFTTSQRSSRTTSRSDDNQPKIKLFSGTNSLVRFLTQSFLCHWLIAFILIRLVFSNL